MRKCRVCSTDLVVGANWRGGKARHICRPCDNLKLREDYATGHFYQRRDLRRILLRYARYRAKQKGLEFTLTPDDIFIPTHCPALNIPLVNGGGKGMEARWNSPSLDRIDNTKGYVPGNVIVVSFRANAIKNAATPSEVLKVGLFYTNLQQQS